LLLIMIFGMVINLIQSVCDWVASVEEEAKLASNPVVIGEDVEASPLKQTLREYDSKTLQY